MPIRFEIVENKAGEWFPRIRGGNGEKWFHSESHKRKADARRGLVRLVDAICEELIPFQVASRKRGGIPEVPRKGTKP